MSKHTPGPWHLCGIDKDDNACECLTIGAKDQPIAKVIHGEWGDDYPIITLEGPTLKRKAVATMAQITYGEIPMEEALANARILASALRLKEALEALVVKLDRIFSSNEYLSVFTIAQVHHGPYRGENCVEEMDAARKVLKELER